MSAATPRTDPGPTAGELAHFHVLGHAPDADEQASTDPIPAALAPYRDLTSLRHDDPFVLCDDTPRVRSLVDVIDRALRQHVPPGPTGERIRSLVLRVEGEVRRRVADGERGSLRTFWDAALHEVLSVTVTTDGPSVGLEAIRCELPASGRVVGCDTDVSVEVIAHLWRTSEAAARAAARDRIDELHLGLSNILRADDARSEHGRSADRLSAGVGEIHRDVIDFEAWSDVLRTGPSGGAMTAARRRRLESAIDVLRSQRFFPRPGACEGEAFEFTFTSCDVAAAAYAARVPEMVRLVRAMAIAELELHNGYREHVHDPVFEQFDERSLTPDDVASFPSYLVCTTDRDLSSIEQTELLGILGSDAPINVLVAVRDVLGEPGGLPLVNGSSRSSIGRRLGTMAMGLGTAFVLQTVSANLARVADRIEAGLAAARPALISVFTGSPELAPGLPPFLVAMTAMQARAVPTFVFDPGAGSSWADRFDVATNPDPSAAWSAVRVDFEDADMQRRHEMVGVTPVDLAVFDPRYRHHFAPAPPASWNGDMEPVADMIASAGVAMNGEVPYLLMAGESGVLQRVIVDRQLLREVRHFGETWRSLQELAGIDNSHALAALTAARERWEEDRDRERADADEGRPRPPADVVDTIEPEEASAASDDVAAAVPDVRTEGEAYIETVRCTTCDECTELNPRMFAYDENKQAYLVDPTAGTFRELVEAAEACQVAIIHPGTPWDPSEPDLDELVARAAAFA